MLQLRRKGWVFGVFISFKEPWERKWVLLIFVCKIKPLVACKMILDTTAWHWRLLQLLHLNEPPSKRWSWITVWYRIFCIMFMEAFWLWVFRSILSILLTCFHTKNGDEGEGRNNILYSKDMIGWWRISKPECWGSMPVCFFSLTRSIDVSKCSILGKKQLWKNLTATDLNLLCTIFPHWFYMLHLVKRRYIKSFFTPCKWEVYFRWILLL